MLDGGQLEDGPQLLTGLLRFRDGKRWKKRLCELRRLSPVADTLHLQLFKEGPRGLQSKASLSLDNFRAIETGFTLDRESNTLALLCDGSSIVLAFDAREALIQWQVKIAASVPYVQQFSGQLIVTPARCKIGSGAARLHVQDLRVSLVMGTPPRLVATWAIADLRRYGPAEGKYVLEGGSRCGRAEGLYVLGVSGGLANTIHSAVEEAAQCRLQARRKLARKHDDSPCGLSRRTVSRSCSRDSTITRSRDSGLCRQASLQWSACSSDDCDLSSDPSAAAAAAAAAASGSSDVCRPCGDGQSEVSAGSSGSDSAAGRPPPCPGSGFGPGSGSSLGSACGRIPRSGSSSGPALRSPRPARRCSADCACAVKVSRSSLRRTGVLDGVGEEPRPGRTASTPISPPLGMRYVDHVYEEPGEKRINGCHTPHRPITSCDAPGRPITAHDASPGRPMTACDPSGRVVRTVAEIHGCDPGFAGYDRPRPALPAVPSASSSSSASSLPSSAATATGTGARLSPDGVSEHLYEDPGPAEGWYQTPRACAVCRRRGQESEQEQEGVYRHPACPCAACGGHSQTERVEAKHRVDGSGRMPVMNADTGQLEVPAEPLPTSTGQLCPQIPSEQILDTGLYSQPSRPAYAVVDRSRRAGQLLPGLAPPPLPAAPAAAPAEPQYANTPPAPTSGDPNYVNCSPAGIDGSTGIEGAGSVYGGAGVHRPGVIDGATYVNCSPAPPQQQQKQYQQQQCQHQQQQQCQHQPLYVNAPACLAASPTGHHPPGDYLPMRPPSGAQPPPGEDYLEMSGRPSRAALPRSLSAESGRQVALRSASLGRKPMPSPKPERFRHLVVARGPGQTAAAAREEETRSSTLPGGVRPSAGCFCDGLVTSQPAGPVTSQETGSTPAVPPLQFAESAPAGPEERQTPLSARSGTSGSPRVPLLSQKPRSGPEYQCLDRRQLLAQMSEPGPGVASRRGYSVDI